jgi:nucleoside-diphosphate-sugar epimerase
MKLFVTGGTGFVGSHFLAQALSAGHQVTALRRPGSKPHLALPAQPHWLEGPLDGQYESALQGVDVLVHLAAHTPNPPYAPLQECLHWNVQAAVGLAAQAHAAGVGRFLVAGTCFEYGQAADRVRRLTKDTPLEPTLSYPTSKAAASLAFQGFAREARVQLKLLRIFQVYGEGEQPERLWPSLRAAARSGADFPMSPGGQVRDFIEVGAVARQFLAHLDFTGTLAGQPWAGHVASGQPRTVLEFAQFWWQHWGASGQLQPGALPYRAGEIMWLAPDLDWAG